MYTINIIIISYNLVYLLIYLWIIGDSILFTYPLLIFNEINNKLWINDQGFRVNQNKWKSVMRYISNSVNNYDYNLRIYLLNYLYFMLNKSSQKHINHYYVDYKPV